MRRELDADALAVAKELQDVRAQVKGLQEREGALKARLMIYLGGAEEGTVNGLPFVRVITSEKEWLDVKALRASASYRHIVEMFTRPSISVQMRVADAPGNEPA